MKRKIFPLAVLLLLLAGSVYLNNLLPVITGYAAKNLASGIFVAGRTQESLETEDLDFFPVNMVCNTVNREKQEVTSRFLWRKAKAIRLKGYGCTLLKDFSEKEIRNRYYPEQAALPGKPDTVLWPFGELLPDSLPSGIDRNKLNRVTGQLMADTLPYRGTFALMVLYKGLPVAEAYRGDMSPTTRFLSWSMAKSVTSALIGIRVQEGKLDINKPLDLPGWQVDERRNINPGHLLHMNSGLSWDEDYGGLSDVTVMLYKAGDMGNYTARKPLETKPGTKWKYSSGTTNLASMVLRRSFSSDRDYFDYPRKVLFNPLGMRSAVFELDASGTFAGSSYLYAGLRDYARFGLLYLNRGRWMGRQLLQTEWIDYTLTPASGSEGRYGAFFWLNRSGTELPDAPADTYLCKGHDGQFIIIIPSRELVVVRMGYSRKSEFDANRMIREILNCLE
ncbi:MAG: serine hydrolase domain-containing protein [Mangrovibacterium sp.]